MIDLNSVLYHVIDTIIIDILIDVVWEKEASLVVRDGKLSYLRVVSIPFTY